VRGENVFFAGGRFDSEDRPPKVPFRLYRFTRLKTFAICKPIPIDIGELFGPDLSMTVGSYEALSEDGKLALWEVSGIPSLEHGIRDIERYGRGSWLCELARDGVCILATSNSPDNEDGDAEEDEDRYDTDWELSCTATEAELAKYDEDNQLRQIKIVKKMRIVMEGELYLI
jgi:hypothetical protein